jgi:hypothetical protein
MFNRGRFGPWIPKDKLDNVRLAKAVSAIRRFLWELEESGLVVDGEINIYLEHLDIMRKIAFAPVKVEAAPSTEERVVHTLKHRRVSRDTDTFKTNMRVRQELASKFYKTTAHIRRLNKQRDS